MTCAKKGKDTFAILVKGRKMKYCSKIVIWNMTINIQGENSEKVISYTLIVQYHTHTKLEMK